MILTEINKIYHKFLCWLVGCMGCIGIVESFLWAVQRHSITTLILHGENGSSALVTRRSVRELNHLTVPLINVDLAPSHPWSTADQSRGMTVSNIYRDQCYFTFNDLIGNRAYWLVHYGTIFYDKMSRRT